MMRIIRGAILLFNGFVGVVYMRLNAIFGKVHAIFLIMFQEKFSSNQISKPHLNNLKKTSFYHLIKKHQPLSPNPFCTPLQASMAILYPGGGYS